MEYTTRIVRSVEGLSQEDALITLQEHPGFRAGTRIASLTDQDGRWVAKLLEPKFANEEELDMLTEKEEKKAEPKLNPSEKAEHEKHEKSESPEEEHEEHESPKEEKEEHKADEDSDDAKIKALEQKIDKLLDALGLAGEKAPKGPSAEGPIPPAGEAGPIPPAAPAAPKAPKAAPKGPELPPGSGAKLKPGEVPNKPGVTPIGSPAFASVKQANPTVNPPVITTSPAAASSPAAAASCAKCGGTGCDQCRAAQGASAPQAAPAAGSAPATVTSFVVSRLDSDKDVTIRQAKLSLENEFASRGFRVARIKREGEYLHGLMVRNDS